MEANWQEKHVQATNIPVLKKRCADNVKFHVQIIIQTVLI